MVLAWYNTCHVSKFVLWHWDASVEDVQSPCNALETKHVIPISRYVNLVQNFIAGLLVLLTAMLLTQHLLLRCLRPYKYINRNAHASKQIMVISDMLAHHVVQLNAIVETQTLELLLT